MQLIDTQLGIHARAGLHLGRSLLAWKQHGHVHAGAVERAPGIVEHLDKGTGGALVRPGNIDVRSGAVAGKQVAGLKQQIRYAAVQVHGGSDGNVFAHDLAHAGGDHALAVLQVHHARGAMDGEQHGIERLLAMGLLEQCAKLIEPRVEKLVSHRATGKGARIGKGHPLDAFDALDGAKALEARGIDRRGVARDPRMAVEQLLAAAHAKCGLA